MGNDDLSEFNVVFCLLQLVEGKLTSDINRTKVEA